MISPIKYEIDRNGATVFSGLELLNHLKTQERQDIKLLATFEVNREETQSNAGILTLAAFIDEKEKGEHYHLRGREFYIVVNGTLKITWGKAVYEGQEPETEGVVHLKQGDCFVVNRGYWHSIEKEGSEDLLVYTFKVPPDSDAVDMTINGKVKGKFLKKH